MVIVHHNKDLDGFSSGAICKLKYPDSKLIGWDYKDPIPELTQFNNEDVILIDISFPMEVMANLAFIAKSVTWIDHHISAKRDYDNALTTINQATEPLLKIKYIYDVSKAACEIGWNYLFPEQPIPYSITLLGRYDTWRKNEGNWDNETLPFQYYTSAECTSAETFPKWLLENEECEKYIWEAITSGVMILKYQRQQDFLAAQRSSFERKLSDHNGNALNAICINSRFFSSDTLKSVYDDSKHDLMLGFEYTGTKWTVSLRSFGDKADCSMIAKSRGGGGHKNASGFECNNFNEIFK